MAPSKKVNQPLTITFCHQSSRNKPQPPPVEEEEESSDSDASVLQQIVQAPRTHSQPGPDDDQNEESREKEDIYKTSGEEADEEDEALNSDVSHDIPAKRKAEAVKAPSKKKKMRAPPANDPDDNLEFDEQNDPPEPAPIPRISFTITTFSVGELNKAASRRKAKSRLIDLASDIAWIDVRAHLKIAICDLLFPHHATVDDNRFEMTWSIPRLVTNALSLNTDADYKQLVKNALKSKDPAVKITVEELPVEIPANNNENIPPAQVFAPPAKQPAVAVGAAAAKLPEAPKQKQKSKIRREADILPGNVAINEKIKQLRCRWECNLSSCSSEFCFIPAEGPHYFLSHDHVEKWAAAILADRATLEHPPNSTPFDAVSTKTISAKSPILQERLNTIANEKAPLPLPPPPPPPPAPAPVVQVVFPNNPYAMYPGFPVNGDHGNGNPLALPIPPALPGAPAVAPSTLIPSDYIEGVKLNLATFCTMYALSDTIKQHLADNKITGTHAFAHLTDGNLKEMGFKIGQVIDLKEAIKEWAQKCD